MDRIITQFYVFLEKSKNPSNKPTQNMPWYLPCFCCIFSSAPTLALINNKRHLCLTNVTVFLFEFRIALQSH